MRSSRILFIAAVLGVATYSPISAANAQAPAKAHADRQGIVWGPAPATLPGAEIAVLDGNPGQPGPFTLRLRFPNGYKIQPHTHPTVENVTVLSGTFLKGMGTRFVETELQPLERDGFATIPANHPHYAMARGVTVVQVHGIGPFTLTYVDPATAVAR